MQQATPHTQKLGHVRNMTIRLMEIGKNEIRFGTMTTGRHVRAIFPTQIDIPYNTYFHLLFYTPL